MFIYYQQFNIKNVSSNPIAISTLLAPLHQTKKKKQWSRQNQCGAVLIFVYVSGGAVSGQILIP